MGVVNSCCIPRKRCCGTRSKSNTSRPRGYRRSLSDTFNLSVIDDTVQKTGGVNINTATEEELMTLSGINRIIAKNIIDYRSRLGGFRCVEDLALASGVGAERLSHIRHEVYVLNVPNGSIHSQRSFTNVSTQTHDFTDSDLIDINSSNASELITVKNIGNSLANNIVTHRDKHGKFKNLDELYNVKGIGPVTLEEIKPFLTVEETTDDNGLISQMFPNPQIQSNGDIRSATFPNSPRVDSPVRRSSIENLLLRLGPSEVSTRPVVEKVSLKYNNEPIIRIASWNLEDFSLSKAKHLGVKDVVCMTILENGLGIIAFQELTSKEALSEICQELNHPTLPNTKKWKGRRGLWECVVSSEVGRMFQAMEYSGFIYNKAQRINLISSSLLEKADSPSKAFTRNPFLAAFKIDGKFDCILINVHLKAAGLRKEDIGRTQDETDKIIDVIHAVHMSVKDEKDVIILGDFNMNPDADAFQPLQNKGYVNCIPASEMTNIGKNNPTGSRNYDNIWISRHTQRVLAESGRVIRQGLWSPWIPSNWEWGGYVSNHCPVLASFYTARDFDKGRIEPEHFAQQFMTGDNDN